MNAAAMERCIVVEEALELPCLLLAIDIANDLVGFPGEAAGAEDYDFAHGVASLANGLPVNFDMVALPGSLMPLA